MNSLRLYGHICTPLLKLTVLLLSCTSYSKATQMITFMCLEDVTIFNLIKQNHEEIRE